MCPDSGTSGVAGTLSSWIYLTWYRRYLINGLPEADLADNCELKAEVGEVEEYHVHPVAPFYRVRVLLGYEVTRYLVWPDYRYQYLEITQERDTKEALNRCGQVISVLVIEGNPAQTIQHVHKEQHAKTHFEGDKQLHTMQGILVPVEGGIY